MYLFKKSMYFFKGIDGWLHMWISLYLEMFFTLHWMTENLLAIVNCAGVIYNLHYNRAKWPFKFWCNKDSTARALHAIVLNLGTYSFPINPCI